jgi:hypothetical protein
MRALATAGADGVPTAFIGSARFLNQGSQRKSKRADGVLRIDPDNISVQATQIYCVSEQPVILWSTYEV